MPFLIVYLDDEPDLCQIFTDLFTTKDVKVMTFTEPTEAISYILREKPNLVFLDYRLPETTGDEVSAAIGPEFVKALITGDLTIVPRTEFLKIFKKPYRIPEIKKFITEVLGE